MIDEPALREGARAAQPAGARDAATLRAFGELMHEHWEHKKRRSGGMSNPQIDEWYELGREERRDRRQAGRRRRRRLPDVLRRGSSPAARGDGEGRPRGSALPLRLRRHEGAVLVSLPVAMLAGGLATRLRPLTEHDPEGAGRRRRPAVRRASARAASRARASTDVVFCVGHLGEQVARRARRRLALGHAMSATSSTADACSAPAARCGARCRCSATAFFVLYGDSYLDCDYAAVERAFRASGKPG